MNFSNILKVMMQYVGPVFLFLLKFIEWWYSGDRQGAVRKFTALPNPPPPAPVTLKVTTIWSLLLIAMTASRLTHTRVHSVKKKERIPLLCHVQGTS